MLRYWVCAEDGVREADGRQSPPAGGFLWIEAVDPSPQELAALPIDPFIAVNLGPQQRARFDQYGEQTVFVVKTLWYLSETSAVETGDVIMVVDETLLISVRHGQGDPITPARQGLSARPLLLSHGVWGAVHVITEQVIEDYLGVADEITGDVTELERKVLSGPRVNAIAGIYSLKREVLEFRDAVEPIEGVSDYLMSRPLFREVAHRFNRVTQSVRSSDDLLDAILNAHLGQISMWQNEDMRKISAWAAIITVPTMIAGIYSMNFIGMPELRWTFGYPAVLGLMAVLCVVLFRSFRRNNWL
ncbi:magnesium and cobalt transport protein CorA [Nonomuraea sp. NPDC050536]|uniref:magnesium and cobalt transport protein CorA n=1 Tax=Nonomuraea sp. NPDC050536 TaxID=3364366 RepID=UPI0037C4F299